MSLESRIYRHNVLELSAPDNQSCAFSVWCKFSIHFNKAGIFYFLHIRKKPREEPDINGALPVTLDHEIITLNKCR